MLLDSNSVLRTVSSSGKVIGCTGVHSAIQNEGHHGPETLERIQALWPSTSSCFSEDLNFLGFLALCSLGFEINQSRRWLVLCRGRLHLILVAFSSMTD